MDGRTRYRVCKGEHFRRVSRADGNRREHDTEQDRRDGAGQSDDGLRLGAGNGWRDESAERRDDEFVRISTERASGKEVPEFVEEQDREGKQDEASRLRDLLAGALFTA